MKGHALYIVELILTHRLNSKLLWILYCFPFDSYSIHNVNYDINHYTCVCSLCTLSVELCKIFQSYYQQVIVMFPIIVTDKMLSNLALCC